MSLSTGWVSVILFILLFVGVEESLFFTQQGESTPGIRKGTCTNHLGAIQKFFKGIHITVNARTEDEVDEEAIIDKVAKATGSIYNFSRLESREDESSGPVVNIFFVLPHL